MFPRKILGAVRLACILNHDETVPVGKSHDRIHIGHLAVKVHRNNCCDRPAAALADELACRILRAVPLKILLKHFDRHVQREFVHIHEFRNGPGLRDCLCSGDERIGNGDNHVSGLHA